MEGQAEKLYKTVWQVTITCNLGVLMAKQSFHPFSKDIAWNLSFHKN
jgi:hypothetical protein